MIYSNPECQQVEWEDSDGNVASCLSTELAPEQLATVEPYANKAIYAQLRKVDAKSIRALREGNAVRIAELEAQAVALRSQLQ
jgi:hypothetical protein